MVGLVAAALIVAGAGSLLVARVSSRHDAARQLLEQGETLSSAVARVKLPRVVLLVDRVLRLEGGSVVEMQPGGQLTGTLPAGLDAAGVDTAALAAGTAVSGWQGNLAYAAVPLSFTPRVAAHLAVGAHYVVVLTQPIGPLGASWGYLLAVFVVILGLTAVVAAFLSRRVTRPVLEAADVAGRISRGELAARVETRRGDIAELTSLAESVNAMAAGLQGAREREGQLLLSVSHDLRTPLTSIRGYAEAIQDGVSDVPADAAGVIVVEAKRLERLVADLLDLAKLETQHLSLRIEPVDAGVLVGQVAAGFAPEAARRHVALEVTAAGTHRPVAAADPDRLAQILANLTENAIGYAAGRVVLAADQVEGSGAGEVRLTVTDDGPGIPPEALDRVFDRFYQVDHGAAVRGGSGLGLAIVAELVQAMGGAVHAESPLTGAGGTRMVVTLRAPGSPPRPDS